MAQINFPTATSNGQTFEADNGVIYTYVGTPPNGFWSGSFQATGLTTLDARFLKLDSSNDPVTGTCEFSAGVNVTGGNVGIGTNSPSEKIEVVDTSPTILARATANSSAKFSVDNARSSDVIGGQILGQWNGNTVSRIDFRNGLDSANEDDGEIAFGTSSANSSVTERVRIDSSGNVGIGTADPLKTLHLSSSNPQMRFTDTTTNVHFDINANSSAGNVALNVDDAATSSQSSFILNTRGTERFRIVGTSGNVGIGTAAPATKLTVGSASDTDQRISIFSSAPNNGDLYGSIEFRVSGSGGPGNKNAKISAIRKGGSSGADLAFFTRTHGDATNNDGGQERMRIGATGKVGIGTSNPSSQLDIVASGGDVLSLTTTGGSCKLHFADSGTTSTTYLQTLSNDFRAVVNGGERVRIASNGNVGIGTGSPIAQVTARGINSGGQGGTMCIQNTGSGVNTNVALYLTPNNGGGNDFARTAAIKSRQDTAGNYADLEFYTSASNTPAEQMRISSSGHILIHQNSSSVPGFNNTTIGANFEKNSTGTSLFISRSTQASLFCNRNSNGNLIRFFRSGTQVGRIDVTTSNATFVTTSDYRLKENVTSLSDGIDRFKLLTPCRFNFIAEPGQTIDGFIAHELSDVVPEAVFGEKDAMEEQEVEVTPAVLDEDGNVLTEAVTETKSIISPQGIDPGKLVPLLTAALQETIAKVEALERRLVDAGIA
jgi:hypothetical protein